MSFESTTVVVTGGGSGIGAKTAQAFGAAGASAVIADLNGPLRSTGCPVYGDCSVRAHHQPCLHQR